MNYGIAVWEDMLVRIVTDNCILRIWTERHIRRSRSINSRHNQTSNCLGATLVEFSIVGFIVILLVGSLFDWGLFFLNEHLALEALRETAHIASTDVTLIRTDAAGNPFVDPVEGANVQQMLRTKLPQNLTCPTVNVAQILVPMGGVARPALKAEFTCSYNFNFMQLIGINSLTISRSTLRLYEPLAA